MQSQGNICLMRKTPQIWIVMNTYMKKLMSTVIHGRHWLCQENVFCIYLRRFDRWGHSLGFNSSDIIYSEFAELHVLYHTNMANIITTKEHLKPLNQDSIVAAHFWYDNISSGHCLPFCGIQPGCNCCCEAVKSCVNFSLNWKWSLMATTIDPNYDILWYFRFNWNQSRPLRGVDIFDILTFQGFFQLIDLTQMRQTDKQI